MKPITWMQVLYCAEPTVTEDWETDIKWKTFILGHQRSTNIRTNILKSQNNPEKDS